VAAVAGVEFINDSKATNVGATQAALDGLGDRQHKRIILLAGGDGKGADFSPLRNPIAQFVKLLIVFGQDAQRLAAAVADVVSIARVANMAEAVAVAKAQAETGDIVLLSPACASLDMYRNFAARGEDFTQQVLQA
jgi:UDP-N-acetylmuramoylalanine--D-glutamate ligase